MYFINKDTRPGPMFGVAEKKNLLSQNLIVWHVRKKGKTQEVFLFTSLLTAENNLDRQLFQVREQSAEIFIV